jgi:hypothetical protein
MLWAVFLGPGVVGVAVGLGLVAVVVAEGRLVGVVRGGDMAADLGAGSESHGSLVDLRFSPRDGYRLVATMAVGDVVDGVGGVGRAVVVSCCRPGTVAIMTWGDWKKGGTVRSKGLMTGLEVEFDGEHEANAWHSKSFSGSGESSAKSQAVHASVAGKPNELAERAGERGDKGETAESDAKSVPKSSVSKKDMGEKSGYVCFDMVSGCTERKAEATDKLGSVKGRCCVWVE